MSATIARKVFADLSSASWIREMFEKGRRLKAELGEDQVADLSLGNPNAPPPKAFFEALAAVAADRRPPLHRYMPNAGLDEARAAVAAFVSREYRLNIEAASVILTSGAAGGLNVALHAICNPGDEVIVLAPYFPEYRFYIEQVAAHLLIVPTDAQFQPDPDVLAGAMTDRTRAVIVNTPNNPTGAVYSDDRCRAIADVLRERDRPDRPVYLLLDDPYRRILYDLDWAPTPASHYDRTIIVSSYSKDLSIPGERMGYIALPPSAPDAGPLLAAMIMLNRTLGFVNAGATMQRVIARCADACCDLSMYRRNRDALCDALTSSGYQFVMPQGALYVFARTPIEDDAAFVDLLLKQRVLTVPGRGFGLPGHMRISFCVEPETITRSIPGFIAAMESAASTRA